MFGVRFSSFCSFTEDADLPEPQAVLLEIYLSWAQTNFRFRKDLLYLPALDYFLLSQMLCIQRTNTAMKNPSDVVDRVFKGTGISAWFLFELNLMPNELCHLEHKPHTLPWICKSKHKCRSAHDKSTPSFWQCLCTKVPVTRFKRIPQYMSKCSFLLNHSCLFSHFFFSVT